MEMLVDYDRILKVDRTIADLAGSSPITGDHVSEAIGFPELSIPLPFPSYRSEARLHQRSSETAASARGTSEGLPRSGVRIVDAPAGSSGSGE